MPALHLGATGFPFITGSTDRALLKIRWTGRLSPLAVDSPKSCCVGSKHSTPGRSSFGGMARARGSMRLGIIVTRECAKVTSRLPQKNTSCPMLQGGIARQQFDTAFRRAAPGGAILLSSVSQRSVWIEASCRSTALASCLSIFWAARSQTCSATAEANLSTRFHYRDLASPGSTPLRLQLRHREGEA